MNRSGNIGAAKNMDSVFADFTDEELEQDLIFDEDDQLVEIVEGYTENGNTIFEEDEQIFKIADEIMNDDNDGDKPEQVRKDTEDILGPDSKTDQNIKNIEDVEDRKLDDSQTIDNLKKNGESEADKELGLDKLEDEYHSSATVEEAYEKWLHENPYEYDKDNEAEGTDDSFGSKIDNSTPEDDLKNKEDENYQKTADASVKENAGDLGDANKAEGTDTSFGNKEMDNTMPKDDIKPDEDENHTSTNDATIKEAFLVECASLGVYSITEAKFRFLPKFKEEEKLKSCWDDVKAGEEMLNNEGIDSGAGAQKAFKIILRVLDVLENVDGLVLTVPIITYPLALLAKAWSYLLNAGQEAAAKSYANKVIAKLNAIKDKCDDESKKQKIQNQIDSIKDKLAKMKEKKKDSVKETFEARLNEEACDCGKEDCPICNPKEGDLAPDNAPTADVAADGERHEESNGETITNANGESIAPNNVDDNTLPKEDEMTPDCSPKADNGDITDDGCEGKECKEAEVKPEVTVDVEVKKESGEAPVAGDETNIADTATKPEDESCGAKKECGSTAGVGLDNNVPVAGFDEAAIIGLQNQIANLTSMIKKLQEGTTGSGTEGDPSSADSTDTAKEDNNTEDTTDINKSEETVNKFSENSETEIPAPDAQIEKIEPVANKDDEVKVPETKIDGDTPAEIEQDEIKRLEEAFNTFLESEETEEPTKSDISDAAKTEVEDTESEIDDALTAVADDDSKAGDVDLEYDPTDEELIDFDEATLLEDANNGVYSITEAKFSFFPKFKEREELKDALNSAKEGEDILNQKGESSEAGLEKGFGIALRILDVINNVESAITTPLCFIIVGLPMHLILRGINLALKFGKEKMAEGYCRKTVQKLAQLRDKAEKEEDKERIQKQIDKIQDKMKSIEESANMNAITGLQKQIAELTEMVKKLQ